MINAKYPIIMYFAQIDHESVLRYVGTLESS